MFNYDDSRLDENEFDCPTCNHNEVTLDADNTITCPNCRESYSLVVHEDFTLLETDGWATGIAFEAPDGSMPDATE